MSDVSVIVFDLDGVLVDTTPAHARAYDELWQSIGVSGPDYPEIAGRTTIAVVTDVTRSLAPNAAEIHEWVRFKQQRARAYLETENIVFPDTFAVVTTLAKRGLRLAVGTGASRANTQAALHRLGCAELFSPVIAAEDVSAGKPAPEVYQKAMSAANTMPAQTLIVEDSKSGLAAALDAGAFVISVRSGESAHHPRFLGSYPDLHALLALPELSAP